MFERAIRTAWFEPDASPLVAAACPILLDVRSAMGTRGFLRIHWARGPHLDCVIEEDAADLRDAVHALAAWVERHPSTTPLPSDFAERSQRMADAEQWSGPLEPLLDNNSVALIANERATLWGSEPLWQAAAGFHCEILPDIAALVAVKQRARGTFLIAVARRLAAIGSIAESCEYAFWPTSFSAHARLFLTAHPTMRPSFEEAWNRLRAPAVRAIGEIVSGDAPDLAGWLGAAASLDAWLKVLQAQPGAPIAPIEVNNPLHIQDTLGSAAQVSQHLHAMFDTERLAAVFASPLHHRFRIVVNVAYEALACATITPVERALACYLLSRAVVEDFPAVAAQATERVRVLAGAPI
ncbi:hypothetical protein RZN05_03615 [Sphingomonas sp. HF-S4]|uniref:Thiopeptide-type bacteriocin biosynthesis domain-containing protein n=1 Tax=Sphingomonas agrestis TaxID=3080540 RepID=A0ABU3Y4N0_9SPHN|nr:hypothetical protein [Sphingomonas sp. HF-S4]MDV3456057.1 hypothetical protein [Sphingomonas sp. HF-S4]